MQTVVVHNAALQGGKTICIANEMKMGARRKGARESRGGKETVDHINEKLAL